MRAAFSKMLIELAQNDPNVLLITGDHGYGLFDEFRKACPHQYINAGIAEQNMVGMAAGLARIGFRPFVYGLSAFIPIRVLEQIKLDLAHDNLPVVLIGDGAGFVYSHLGTSHQSTEDIAALRAVPQLSILSPADRYEMLACMQLAYSIEGTVYLRIGKSDRGDVHKNPINALKLGELLPLRTGAKKEFTLIATGSMVKTALEASNQYANTAVWSAPSIKPISINLIVDIIQNSRGLIVMEEHSTIGGLGSAIAEIASELSPCRILRIGTSDRFSEHCGSYEYLLQEHKLDKDSILEKIQTFSSSF